MSKLRAIIQSLGLLLIPLIEASSYEVKSDLLGKLEINGALSGYFITGKKVTEDARRTRTDISSGLVSISKKAEPIGFVLTGGVYATPVIGIDHLKTTDYTELFSPLPVAYFEINPVKNLSLMIGRMGTLVGFEAPFTYQNNYIQRGLVWNMQPLLHHGVRLSYSFEKISLKLGLNDGYYSMGVDSFKSSGKEVRETSLALEGSFSYALSSNLNIAFNFLIPEKDTKPNEASNPANKRQYNLVAAYTLGNFTGGLDLLYVDSPKSDKAQVLKRASAYGGALHLALDRAPFKIAGRVEYVRDKNDKGDLDLLGIGEKNSAYTLTLSPGYYKDPLFVRIDLSYVKAQDPFTYNNKTSQSRFALEVGFKF